VIFSSCSVFWGATKNRQSIAYGEHLDSHFNLDLRYGEQAENLSKSVFELKTNNAKAVQCFVAPNDHWTNLQVVNPDTLINCFIYEVFSIRGFEFARFKLSEDGNGGFEAPLYSFYGLADSVQLELQKPFLKEGFHHLGGNMVIGSNKVITNID
jgi:hypothetical protein